MTIGNYFRLKVGEFFVKQYLKFEKEWFGRFILDGVLAVSEAGQIKKTLLLLAQTL